jgi:hypothetical protein
LARKPVRTDAQRDWQLEGARAEIAQLTEAVKARAIELAVARRKSGWGLTRTSCVFHVALHGSSCARSASAISSSVVGPPCRLDEHGAREALGDEPLAEQVGLTRSIWARAACGPSTSVSMMTFHWSSRYLVISVTTSASWSGTEPGMINGAVSLPPTMVFMKRSTHRVRGNRCRVDQS